MNSKNKLQVISFVAQKGGTGKSTVCIHLAVYAESMGLDVLVADLDPHSCTTAEWASERESQSPFVITADKDDLNQLKKQAEEEKFDLLLLDCPPYINDIVRIATKISDYTLIPSSPRFADLRTLPRTIISVEPPFAVLLNLCPHGNSIGIGSAKVFEARKLLKNNDIPTFKVSIVRREAFADALNGGQGINEYAPKSKAEKEIKDLFNCIMEIL